MREQNYEQKSTFPTENLHCVVKYFKILSFKTILFNFGVKVKKFRVNKIRFNRLLLITSSYNYSYKLINKVIIIMVTMTLISSSYYSWKLKLYLKVSTNCLIHGAWNTFLLLKRIPQNLTILTFTLYLWFQPVH